MSKRKVLFFHRTLKQSGAARQLINIHNGLDRSRFDPFFVIEHGEKRFFHDALQGARVHVLGNHGDSWRHHLRALLAVLDHERPDCIQAFNPRANEYFYAASFLRELPRLYCAVRNTEQRFRYHVQEALLQSRHRGLIVNSIAIQNEFLRSGVRKRKIHLIYNGVDTTAFAPRDAPTRNELRRKHGFADDEFVVLSVGRIDPQKDIGTTISAVAALIERGVRARFVNLGLTHKKKYRRELLELASKLGVEDRCDFIDPAENVSNYYQLADVMVLASQYEGLPNVLLENMACGKISIVSSAADNDAVVNDGVTGFRFSTGSAEQLAQQLTKVQSLAPTQRNLMADAARKLICERFALERMVAAFEALYDA
jgi:glycosyltransferase involved in cell wall biosynthesis